MPALEKALMIGFGSVAKGVLPLLLKHVDIDADSIEIIDPSGENAEIAASYGVLFHQQAITEQNYDCTLRRAFLGVRQGAVINLSVNVSSVDLMRTCQDLGILYVDTVVDPWGGVYEDLGQDAAKRTNYYLREQMLELKALSKGKTTAVSCCGANPGMVSWLVKQASINLANDMGCLSKVPSSRTEWADFLMRLGVKGIHIAEYDSQKSDIDIGGGSFVNTWSSDGFISEAFQPAELGWGTFENEMPTDANEHTSGSRCSIFLDRNGYETRVRTWTPTFGAHFGYMVTHNESISISDYFSAWDGGRLVYRPTCHYAYRPSDAAIKSLKNIAAVVERTGRIPVVNLKVLDAQEIFAGYDELGVLLYGHKKNAYWYGSRLSNEQAVQLAAHQNATGLQVSSAVISGLIWAIQNPRRGVVEAEEMDFDFCLSVQAPYLGRVEGFYTDWTPILGCDELGVPEKSCAGSPWAVQNVLEKF